jgi:transglutaminase-like putative cysteine protease
MEFIIAAPMDAYLEPAPLIDRDDPAIIAFVDERLRDCTPEEAVRRVFHFVRDEVAHSWDIQGRTVSRSASDALRIREGICYPKSHLIAALLRRAGLPTAVCYQRLTLNDDDDRTGYAVHALNAVYIDGRWSRIDARGNKPGVDAQFSLTEERLAFRIRDEYGEVDYPTLHAEPHPAIVHTLVSNVDALEMYRHRLPDALDTVLRSQGQIEGTT